MNSLTPTEKLKHANCLNETLRMRVAYGVRIHIGIGRWKVRMSRPPAGIRRLGKARLILLATAQATWCRRMNAFPWGAHPEFVPCGCRARASSVNVYLRSAASRSMYYYRTLASWLTTSNTVWPSTVLYLLHGLHTISTY